MNDVVCSLAAPGAGNDEVGAVATFCRAHHLLLALARAHPSLRRAATADLERFADHDTFRTKDATPDLGVLLAATTLCGAIDEPLRRRFRVRRNARGRR